MSANKWVGVSYDILHRKDETPPLIGFDDLELQRTVNETGKPTLGLGSG